MVVHGRVLWYNHHVLIHLYDGGAAGGCNMCRVSVIVPVYQAEKFLKKCVESVVKQTFSDWELLLVDDGCTDNSPAICDACAAEDDRIRVFHRKKNVSTYLSILC